MHMSGGGRDLPMAFASMMTGIKRNLALPGVLS
jgi:hypothetical protein